MAVNATGIGVLSLVLLPQWFKVNCDVQQWLERFYGHGKVPEYEINEKTVDTLLKISKCNISVDRDTEALLRNKQFLAEHYSVESEKIADILKISGITFDDISEECQTGIKSLSSAACILDLKDTSTTSFLLGVNHQCQEKIISGRKRKMELKLSAQLTKKLTAILQKIQQFQGDFAAAEGKEKLQASQLDKKMKQTDFLRSKTKEYHMIIKENEKCLKTSGGDPTVYHQALVKKAEEIRNLQEKLDDVLLRLNSYLHLPPNEDSVRVKVEEAKEELEKLESELFLNIDQELMHT